MCVCVCVCVCVCLCVSVSVSVCVCVCLNSADTFWLLYKRHIYGYFHTLFSYDHKYHNTERIVLLN